MFTDGDPRPIVSKILLVDHDGNALGEHNACGSTPLVLFKGDEIYAYLREGVMIRHEEADGMVLIALPKRREDG